MKKYIYILMGTTLMAVAVRVVYEPLGMVTGGVSGIAIILNKLFKIPVWITNLLVNIPLLWGAWYLKGKKFMWKTCYATVCFTIALYVIPVLPVTEQDYVLAVLFGGVCSGLGLGLVFITGGSTGGTDLLGSILQCFLKRYSVAELLMLIDGGIVIAGAACFGIRNAMYAVIAVYITSKIMDGILEGLKFAKMAFIISEVSDLITKEIFCNLDRGVTELSVRGKYSNQSKKMLFCAVSKKEITKLLDIINKYDKNAFVIITDAREVIGEGFVQR